METIEYLLHRYPVLMPQEAPIRAAVKAIVESYRQGGKVLTCGNGGSASDADHITGELLKGFGKKRPLSLELREAVGRQFPSEADLICGNLQMPLTSVCLCSHPALSTAFLNDVNPYFVFAQQVLAYGKKNDVLLCLSTSGNARNVIHAAQVARALGLVSILLTGSSGGKLKDLCDVVIQVPADEAYRVQELHLPIYHSVCLAVEETFFSQ